MPGDSEMKLLSESKANSAVDCAYSSLHQGMTSSDHFNIFLGKLMDTSSENIPRKKIS